MANSEPEPNDINSELHFEDEKGRRRWPHVYSGGYYKISTSGDKETRIEIKVVQGEPLGPLVDAGFWVRMSGSNGVKAGLISPATLRRR